MHNLLGLICYARMKLSLGFSPCPNDTFIFDALVHHRVDTEGLTFDVRMEDVEALNQLALRGRLDVTKLSYHAYGYLTRVYELLNAGSALGRGVGPLLVTANENLTDTGELSAYQVPGSRRREIKIAIPGELTTANYLLGLAFPNLQTKQVVLFSEIEDRVISGEFDAGLLIHENRFTYHERGLHKILDLGEYWEESTGLPIPLGGIVVKQHLPTEVKEKIDRVLARSITYAFTNPEASADYVATHAQEMSVGVRRKHIELYVNDFTRALGEEGWHAVRTFLEQGRARGVLPG